MECTGRGPDEECVRRSRYWVRMSKAVVRRPSTRRDRIDSGTQGLRERRRRCRIGEPKSGGQETDVEDEADECGTGGGHQMLCEKEKEK